MGQYWRMVAHERMETLGHWGKAPEFLWGPLCFELIPRLAVPVEVSNIGTDHLSQDNPSTTMTTTTTSNLQLSQTTNPETNGSLESLPYDIFFLITAELDLNSLYTLSRCCRSFNYLLRPQVHTRFRRMLAPWADTPLICAGDYMSTNPPDTCLNISKELILARKDDDGEIDSEVLQLKDIHLITAYEYVDIINATNVARDKTFCPPTLNTVLPRTPSRFPWSFIGGHKRFLKRIMKVNMYFPEGRHWVLRNLTTKEYIYAHVLTHMDGRGGGVDSPDAIHPWGFHFGTVVAVKTCWSDDPSTNMQGLRIQGSWSGHHFDIVTEDTLRKDMAVAGDQSHWRDVSERETRAMVELFMENGWDVVRDYYGNMERY